MMPQAAPLDITVLILTYNEARHIQRAIASVRGIAREILVVDSFSTDATVRLAEAAGARVLTHAFVNQARQCRWALAEGGVGTGWILRLDADEVIEPDLADAIAARLPTLPADVVGVNFDRKHVFMGRWIRHGGRYPVRLLRLWRAGHGEVEDRWMDEHVVVHGGTTITLPGGFADISLHDLTFFTDKHNRYATREAIEILSARYALNDAAAAEPQLASRQAAAKRWIKTRVYNRLPFWAGPLGYFLWRYVGQAGFLDGRPGLIYHVLQGFWYRFLVNAKVYEYDAAMTDCTTAAQRRTRLAELTGHPLA